MAKAKARKRKNNKGGGGKKNSYQSLNDNDDQQNTPRRTSARKKKRNQHQNSVFVDDYKLRESVEQDGLTIIDMLSDGNCLFRALSDQLHGDHGNNHENIRAEVCDFMEKNKQDFEIFLVFQDEDDPNMEDDAADFETYISNMRQDGEWGGNLELVAAARLYRRKITVYSSTLAAFSIEHDESDLSGPQLRVSYHDNDHYNSVRDENTKMTKTKTPKEISSQKATSTTSKTNTSKKGNSSTTSTKVSETPDLSINDGGKGGGKKTATHSVKKNAPCPCGSGLKYKKCCLAKQKSQKRLQRMQENNALGEDETEEDEEEMTGNFRVLKI